MRKAVGGVAAVTALAVASLLTGCGGDAASTPDLPSVTTVAPPAPTDVSVLDSAALDAALLTADDLPVGFAALPDPVADLGLPSASEDPEPDRSSTDPQRCADVLAEIADQVDGASARAVARFTGPDFTSVDTDAAVYPDGAAGAAFTAVQDTFTACGQYTGTDADGYAVQYRLGGLDQPSVGDASVAVRLETTSDGFTMTSDAVIAVVGPTLLQVVATGQEPVDPAVLAELARTAVDKLKQGSD
ncbi:sensor domain-containing protein [Rhodococcus sp. NPDC003318]|uniref:sensor domain-containing protein n=1 Tax=Rhodococcus sp. NPDC003318 TaxID=3364503 RepID=UPI00369435D2